MKTGRFFPGFFSLCLVLRLADLSTLVTMVELFHYGLHFRVWRPAGGKLSFDFRGHNEGRAALHTLALKEIAPHQGMNGF